MFAVKLQNQSHLMDGSTYSTFSTNLTDEEEIYYVGGSLNSNARVKGTDIWDEEW